MDASIDIPIDRFTNLANSGSATMLVLAESLGLEKGDTLTINEVDESAVPTGRVGTGLVAAVSSGQFYSLPTGYNQYYLNPLNMAAWVDYSAISTVVGWSSFTEKIIKYSVTGNTCYFTVAISGTSNSATTTFTLPFISASAIANVRVLSQSQNSGTFGTSPGFIFVSAGSNIFTCRSSVNGAAYAASGVKAVYVEGFYEI